MLPIKELVISHRIFLTKEQRYALSNDDTSFSVTGSCLSVWKKGIKTNEPCESEDKQYTISNAINKRIVVQDENTFKIALPDYMSRTGLLDPKDGGSKSFITTYNEVDSSKDYKTIHQVIIGDYSEMLESLAE